MTPTPDDTAAPDPAPRPAKRRHPFLCLFGLLILLCLAAGGLIAWDGWRFLNTAPASPGKDVVVNIEPGSTLADVAALLER